MWVLETVIYKYNCYIDYKYIHFMDKYDRNGTLNSVIVLFLQDYSMMLM